MLLMQQHQGGVMRRLSVIGVPTYSIKPLVVLICKWEECSGVEWTIKRLKSLMVELIRRRAGLAPDTSLSIRKNRRGEYWGVIGSLFRWGLKSEKNFCKVVQAFRAYTFYILPSVSDAQKEKFLAGLNPLVGDTVTPNRLVSFGQSVRRALPRGGRLGKPLPVVAYQGSPGKKAPRLFGMRSVPQDTKVLDDLQIFNTPGGMSLYLNYQRIFDPLITGLGDRREYLRYLKDNNRYPYRSEELVEGGEIHFLQEPGGKLRSVASPYRLFQEALRPLGQRVYEIVRQLPWDCTFNQERAIPHVQSHLMRGGKCFSIDLSSATDLFPLSLQIETLKSVLQVEDWDYIKLFEEISRSKWRSPIGPIRWTKGQPLGLFPSFGTFTLTHGLVLLYLNSGRHDHQFFVLGDDVIILNEKLKNDYQAMLAELGCPWSVDKSISSHELCEFAGKIITSTRVIPQLKWRRLSDDNFLDICRLLGSRSRCLLSGRQKDVFDQVAHLCDPIGLNFSKPGDNLVTMIKRTLNFYRPSEEVLGALMGLRRRIHRNMYSSSESFDSLALQEITATFDEKVKSVMNQTIFSNFELATRIGLEGLSSLPPALGLQPRLPFRETQPSRLSTLVRYERLIRNGIDLT